MPCMRSGLCKYPEETILVSKEALENLAPTMQGVPVVIDHPDMPITDQNIGSLPVVGRVADMHFIQEDDVWYAHFVVDNAKAIELLQQGYGVSTAWIGSKYASGGTFNNCPYDRELIEGRYEHLAIVRTPRYEMAVGPIFLNSKDRQETDNRDIISNANNKGANSMLGKLWKRIIQKEEIMSNSNEEYLIEVDGKEMSLAEIIKNSKKNEDESYDVDGEKMTVNELITAYKNLKTKKNADEEEVKKEDEEKKENAEEEEEKKEEKEEKEDEKPKKNDLSDSKENKEEEAKTNERFEELDDLHQNGKVEIQTNFLSLNERVQMGKNRYGSKK